MAADTISGYIQGLLDGIEFKQTAYALDWGSRKAALALFLENATGKEQEKLSVASALELFSSKGCGLGLTSAWSAPRLSPMLQDNV